MRLFLLLALLTGLSNACLTGAESTWSITATTRFVSASEMEGRTMLTTPDDFLRNLSPFDRAARLKTNGPVNSTDFTNFVARQILPWSETDRQRLGGLSGMVSNRLAGWSLPLPETIWLIKTTGEEEGNTAYTRGAAIIIPVQMLAGESTRLERVLLHEIFHILSRQNSKLRDQLYAQIGFEPCGPVTLPADYAARKITNPDAPISEHHFKGRAAGRELHLLPVLFSRETAYRAGDTRPFFAYLEFRLMEIAEAGGHWQPVLRAGQPAFHQPGEVENFFTRIGRNTQYIIHPEEVLADNFVLLMLGDHDAPNPEILGRMSDTLRSTGKASAP